MNKKDIIICRCEDVTLEDVENIMNEGYTSFEEIKRILRVGMGSCQGNTCGQLLQREISKYFMPFLCSATVRVSSWGFSVASTKCFSPIFI